MSGFFGMVLQLYVIFAFDSHLRCNFNQKLIKEVARGTARKRHQVSLENQMLERVIDTIDRSSDE